MGLYGIQEYDRNRVVSVLRKSKSSDIVYYLSNVYNSENYVNGVPFLFYQFPELFFSLDEPQEEEGYLLKATGATLTLDHLLVLEFLLSRLTLERHKAQASIKTNALRNIFKGKSEKYGEKIIKELFVSSFTVYEENNAAYSFSLFESFACNEEEDSYQMLLTDNFFYLCNLDMKIYHKTLTSSYMEGIDRVLSYILCSATLSVPAKENVSLVEYTSKIGILKALKESGCEGISKKIRDKKSEIRKMFSIVFDADMPECKDVFSVLSLFTRPILERNISSMEFFKAMENGSREEFEVLQGAKMKEEAIEKEVEARVAEKLEEIELDRLSSRSKYVDYEDLLLNPEEALRLSATLGIEDSVSLKELAAYAKWYQDKEIKQTKMQFMDKWISWLEKVKDTPIKGKPHHKEGSELEVTAKVLTYNDSYSDMALKLGFNKLDGEEIFNRFKNHYSWKGTKAEKENWIYAYESWLEREKGYVKKRNSKEDLAAIEANFYYARIVSQEIKNIIRQEGYSVTDFISGELVLEDIEMFEFPVPLKFGKGIDTLFRFKNEKMNKEILSKYTVPASPVEISKENLAEIEPLESDIIDIKIEGEENGK